MPEFPIRKIIVLTEEILHEGGPVPDMPRRRAAALALVKNPYAGRYVAELQPGDVDSWSAAIAELARDGARRDRLAGGARDFALRFDSRRIAEEFIAVLEEIDPSAVQARP